MQGKVKWFDSKRGYGFATAGDGSGDTFLHFSAIVMSGYKTLAEGDSVEYEIVDGPKGKQAANVKKL